MRRGASGFVQLALDTRTNEQIAIKFIERGKRTCHRIIARELLNHRECAMHPHIVQLKVHTHTSVVVQMMCAMMPPEPGQWHRPCTPPPLSSRGLHMEESFRPHLEDVRVPTMRVWRMLPFTMSRAPEFVSTVRQSVGGGVATWYLFSRPRHWVRKHEMTHRSSAVIPRNALGDRVVDQRRMEPNCGCGTVLPLLLA
jgi:hypothetical protein